MTPAASIGGSPIVRILGEIGAGLLLTTRTEVDFFLPMFFALPGFFIALGGFLAEADGAMGGRARETSMRGLAMVAVGLLGDLTVDSGV